MKNINIFKMVQAIFLISIANSLFILGYIVSGGQYKPECIAMLYVGLFLLFIGIIKGAFSWSDFRSEEKEDTQEQN